jgi:hypothetical protein
MVSPHKNLFIRNSLEGRERKLDGAAKTVGRLCAHFVCLPPFMLANFKEQQAEAKVCTIVCATQNLEAPGVVYSALKTRIANAYADNLKVRQGFKYFTHQPRNQASDSKFSK